MREKHFEDEIMAEISPATRSAKEDEENEEDTNKVYAKIFGILLIHI